MSAAETVFPSLARNGAPQKKGGLSGDARRGSVMDTVDDFISACSIKETIDEGFVVLTANQAADILISHRHPKQTRDGKFVDGELRISPLAQAHIDSLADLMQRGAWRDRGLIACARVNGHIVLIDGYHRLHAQVECGLSLKWTIAVYDCSPEEADALFWTFDTVARKRTTQQVLGATDLASKLGVSKDMATACWNCVPLLVSKFSTSKVENDTLTARLPDLRADVVSQFAVEARLLDEWYGHAHGSLKKKLMVSGRLAVALATTKWQPTTAKDFWLEIAKNDGLRRGDARHTLISELLTKNGGSGPQHLSYSATAHAWNSFWHKRNISFLRVGKHPYVKIEGTPFDGSGR